MFGISVTEWMFVLVVVLLLFGGKKIPELARSLGKGVSEFKKGIKEIETDVSEEKPAQPQITASSQSAPIRFDPYTGKPIEAKPISNS